jgi:surface polysaccharide O-acyltransferase-like enzyme
MRRRAEPDWVRAVSTAAVVLLHASSNFALRPSRFTLLGVTPAFFCNQLARFAVPLFFLLSGLTLGFGRPEPLPGFLGRRLRRVGLPYLGWTLFYFLWTRRYLPGVLLSAGSLRLLGRDLLLGGAAAHLWFVPPLLELYLLYPLLRRLLRRRPRLTLACSLLLSLLCTLTVYVPLPLAGRFRAHLWRTFPCWLFYFVLGMALAASGWDKLTAFCEKHWTALLGIGLAAACLYSLDSLRCGDPDSVKPQLFLYAPLCLAVLLAARRPFRQLPRGEAAAAFLAKHSMTVYFVHVFVLQVLRLVPAFQGSALGMLGLFAACLLLSCAAAVFLDALAARLRRIPFPRRAA